MNEYLMGRTTVDQLTQEQLNNLNTLIPNINDLLERFGEYRKCNSGFRSLEDQKRINPKSMSSKHLYCAAIDLEDKNNKLKEWILNNIKILEDLNLWCEDFSYTPTWVHLQCIPPKSKNRFFKPY